MKERKTYIDGIQYNLYIEDEIQDIKVCALIEYKEELRKKNKLKFYTSDEMREMIENV